jgi:RNA polymerase sigma factor (sigma-70 family)
MNRVEFLASSCNVKTLITMAQNGDIEIRNKVTLDNMGLVSLYLRRNKYSFINHWEELTQEGWMGLARAIKTFDSRKSDYFSTYAMLWIRDYVDRAVRGYVRGGLRFHGRGGPRPESNFDYSKDVELMADNTFSNVVESKQELALALKSLKPGKASEIFHKFIMGDIQREIASEYKCSYQNIGQIISRQVGLVRNTLGEKYD